MKPFTILLFIFLLYQLISVTVSQPNYLYRNCSNGVNYTANSTYRQNLNALLSSFSTSNIPDGFYNLSVGNPPDQVNGVVLCRGDVSPATCRSCVNDSTVKILQNCPNQIEAIGYYDYCMLRFTNRSIFGVVNQGNIPPTYYMWNNRNVSASELDGFNQALQSLLSNLSSTAALGDSRKKFATGISVSGFYRIYGLTQCTPDISGQACENCLVRIVSDIPAYMAAKEGGRVLTPNCNFRYEIYQFTLNTVAPPPPPTLVEQTPASQGSPSSPPMEEKSSNTERTVLLTVVPVVGVSILIICIFLYFKKQKPKRKLEGISDKYVDELEEENSLQFDFDTVSSATNDFSDQNKLGQGGFGAVYKGTFINGQEIAVKRLSKNSGQGDLEFKTEVLLVAKLQHRNLVRLLGFCLEGVERLLIYEFMPNSSLDYFIFDPVKRTHLNWDRRYKIIEGIAKGLLYLHEDSRLRIIHRDLKASNILLDEEMNPKIADFGMARLFVVDQTQAKTNKIVGTYGYMAPEYAMQGHFSVKSDVYSFGVLILEIVSSQKNGDFQNGEDIDLLSYAWRNWGEGTYMNIVDPSLANGSTSEIMRCIHIGLLCVQENVADRPDMASIVLMLNSYSLALPVPSQPAFFMHSNNESNRKSINEANERLFQNGDDIDLLSFAWRNWRERTYMNIVDPSLANGSTSEIMRCIHIGLLCIQENVDNRPTMASIVLMLNSYSLALPVPSQPAFFNRSNIESNRIWINEASITDLCGR